MKRTIKFRGKRIDTGEWVEGYYVKDPKENHRIYFQPFDESTSNTYYFVIAESVCQFTGLFDKNVKEIYEDDILLLPLDFNGVVRYKEGSFIIENANKKFYYLAEFISNLSYEIIGNIHETPELL